MTETEPEIHVRVRQMEGGGKLLVLNDVAWVALKALIVDYLDEYPAQHEGAQPPNVFLALQDAFTQEETTDK